MKIIVLDGHPLNPGDNPWDSVEALGELTVYARTCDKDIKARAEGAAVIITNKAVVSREVIESLPDLRFITVSATGYNVVDVDAARERGIPVSNVPGYGAASVAQHTFALLLELTNRTGEHDASVRNGEWRRSPDFAYWLHSMPELAGKTMGIVGFGDIGRRVARIALAFGMKVAVHTRTRKEPIGDENFAWVELDELAARADVVTLHCPQTSETEGLVDRAFLDRMKPSAFLINTARGGLVVERDLADALRSGRMAGAAVDVVSVEPMADNNPLPGCAKCIITPHLAWASFDARQRLMRMTAENIVAFQRGEPIHVVNGVAKGLS